MKKIIVKLKERAYPIYIGKNILSNKKVFEKIKEKKFALVTNNKIKSLHLSKIKFSLLKKNKILHIN